MKRTLIIIFRVVALTISVVVSGFVLLAFLILLTKVGGPFRGKSKEEAFDKFFSHRPATVEVVECGGRKYTLGGGSYAFVFKIPEADLPRFMEDEGFKRLDIASDLGGWRLESVIATINRLIKSPVSIEATFDWYEKKTEVTAARIFYSKEKQLAVFLGEGKYPK